MPGAPITIVMRGLPIGKGRPKFVRATGHVYTPDKTADYEDGLAGAAARVMDGRPPIDGPVTIDVVAVFPVPASWSRKKRGRAEAGIIRPTGKPDGDNILKACGDGLNAIVWTDDSRIVDARVRKVYGPVPQIAVKVTPLDLEHIKEVDIKIGGIDG